MGLVSGVLGVSLGSTTLMPRYSVDTLIDPASPLLELSALAGHDVYPDPLPGAGLVTGIGKSVKSGRLPTQHVQAWLSDENA